MRKNFGTKTFLYPMPVLIVATYDENGIPNAMNAAWGGICDFDKIMIDMSSHKTTENIAKTKAFTVSPGDAAFVKECDYVGITSASAVLDKFAKSGFTATKSEFVNAPVINELPMALECELCDILDYGMYIGKIVNVSADESCLGADGLPDLSKFCPITFDPVHHKYVSLGKSVADAFKCGKEIG